MTLALLTLPGVGDIARRHRNMSSCGRYTTVTGEHLHIYRAMHIRHLRVCCLCSPLQNSINAMHCAVTCRNQQLDWASSPHSAIDCWTQGKGAYGCVFKALRGGVQDVAVKQLVHGGTGQLQKFSEVWLALCSARAVLSACCGP